MQYGFARRSRGFTLIELMSIVAILTVLMMVAAPSMQSLIANQRARNAAYDLISDLSLARSEAVKRNRDVVLSPQTAWAQGWTIKAGAAADMVAQRNPLGNGVTVTRSPASVTYDGSGRLTGITSTVRFELFDGRNTYRCISLDPSGQPSTKVAKCP